jgi:hypothetical protein
MIKNVLHIEYLKAFIMAYSLYIKAWTLPNCSGLIILRGYTRILLHRLTPYSEKRPELPQNILIWLKWVQCCTLATTDVIFL